MVSPLSVLQHVNQAVSNGFYHLRSVKSSIKLLPFQTAKMIIIKTWMSPTTVTINMQDLDTPLPCTRPSSVMISWPWHQNVELLRDYQTSKCQVLTACTLAIHHHHHHHRFFSHMESCRDNSTCMCELDYKASSDADKIKRQ